ncbi:hypothetical protein AB1Y20_019108 [Prymnesium parvum]|uniref:Uncharacterized protein n=1 Tax=Prymnesium parvum TaxID=97485 RepID=A0AB34JU24_PRYPA
MLPEDRMHLAFGFDEEEWRRVPQRRREALIQAHLGTFSEGALRGCRLALTRLRRWSEANSFPEAATRFRLEFPAKTSEVIKVMRFLLTQAPLRLKPEQAARYSGHSLRHLMPTLARLFGFPKEERDELARWAPTPEGREAGAEPSSSEEDSDG